MSHNSSSSNSNANNREDEFQRADRDAAALLSTGEADDVVAATMYGNASRSTRVHVLRAAEEAADKARQGDPVKNKTTAAEVPIRDPRVQLGEADEADDVVADPTSATASPSPPRRTGSPYLSSSLFACTDGGACFEACCCAYCVAGIHHNFFCNGRTSRSCCLCCCLCCMDVGLSWVCLSTLGLAPPTALMMHTCCMRHALRRRYHLEGETQACSVSDLFSVCCCLPCALAQHQREIAARGEWCPGVCCSQPLLSVPDAVALS